VQTALRELAATLGGLSAGIMLIAAFIGRTVCRRALLPLNRMAVAASEMDATDLARRLPSVATNDELENLNRSFNSLLDRLQESFERQRRFTGDASHQLRTPLAAILGQIEVALRRERSVDEYQQVLSKVHGRAGHLHRIVESLLFLARANSEARLPDFEPICLNSWLPQQLEKWSESERTQDIVFESHDMEPCVVHVQSALLAELVDILVDNACKYSAPGTPIQIGLERDGNAVCVRIKDQGTGIAEADLPRLFTPFFRSAETRRRGIEGAGLGLSIARRLARLFGGELSGTSRLGVGSCFTLRLPLSGSGKLATSAVGVET
jgi:signal transduction histidine kinase